MHLENRISLKCAAFPNIDLFPHMMPGQVTSDRIKKPFKHWEAVKPIYEFSILFWQMRDFQNANFTLKTWFLPLHKKFRQLFLEVTHFVVS